METKLVAMYLPQYHEIPENNEFWGNGFTDWIAVKNANSLFEGHIQPKIPFNKYYYDLSSVEAIRWQAKLAKENGVCGFGIYHYWFSSEKKVLERPAEIILENPDIDISYCFAWDNTSWVRTWSKIQGNDWTPNNDDNIIRDNKNDGVLLQLDYGSEDDWKLHFEYLLPFFKDSRYLKKDEKPIFLFYTNYNKETLLRMGAYWNKLAEENGFPGLYLITRSTPFNKNKIFDGTLRYEPVFSGWQKNQIASAILAARFRIKKKETLKIYKYDNIWNKILKNAMKCKDHDVYYGAFVGYDDTPRRGNRGKVIVGSTPEKFGGYLRKLREIASKQGKEFLFLTAWNEWGEGAYLEPDEYSKDLYLRQLHALK